MPEPTLQATALRYAAGDLTQAESAAFETRLTTDQDARDALAEAVRLSAAALGQELPLPRLEYRSPARPRRVRTANRASAICATVVPWRKSGLT
jgi:ferric-dicitrate binding protein FerR (iron transport regulator)